MSRSTEPERASWTVPVLLIVVAVTLGLLLVRALLPPYGGVAPLPKASGKNAALGSPTSPPRSPGGARECSRAVNSDAVVASNEEATRAKAASRVATASRRNTEGGYGFRYSPAWGVVERQGITRVIGPRHEFVVSLGPGPGEALPVAYDEFADLMRETYGNVEFGDIDVDCVDGNLSVRARGQGINNAGATFDFLAVIIKPSNGHAVGAFGAWDSRARRARLAVQEVIDSFEAI